MIKSVSDFLKVIEAFYPNDDVAFFRGQGSSEWAVNSSLCRLIKNNFGNVNDSKLHWKFARSLFSEFERNIPSYPEVSILKSYSLNQLDLMFVAQHYGLATRLIDWSKNPLIALYFAVEKINSSKGNSVVYMIFNSEKQKINVFNSESFFDYYTSEKNIWNEFYRTIDDKVSSFNSGIEQNNKFITNEELSVFNRIVNNLYSKKSIDNYHGFSLHGEFNHINFSLLPARLISEMQEKNIKIERLKFYLTLKDILEKDNSLINFLSEISNVTIFTGGDICMIAPLPFNFRIKNQQGVFLFSNSIDKNVYSIECFNENNTINSVFNIEKHCCNNGILRILIPNEFARNIKKELAYYGITKNFVYPELPSYTEVMQENILKKYIDEAQRA